VLSVETCETLLSLTIKQPNFLISNVNPIDVTHTSGRNQNRENDSRFAAKAARRLKWSEKKCYNNSTHLVVATCSIVCPGSFTEYVLC